MTTQLSTIINKSLPETDSFSSDMIVMGQLLYCRDTGRLFVGAGEEASDFNYAGRSVVPFEHVEIITEASLGRLQGMLESLGFTIPTPVPTSFRFSAPVNEAIVIFEEEAISAPMMIGHNPAVAEGPFSITMHSQMGTAELSWDGETLYLTNEETFPVSFELDSENAILYTNPSSELTVTLTHNL